MRHIFSVSMSENTSVFWLPTGKWFKKKKVTYLRTDLSLWCFRREPGDNYQYQTAQTIGIPMCQALMEYDQGNYSRAFELLYPLRYRMVEIGGSDAQVRPRREPDDKLGLQFFYAK